MKKVELKAPVNAEFAGLLSQDALDFLSSLAQNFEPTRQKLLKDRSIRQKEIDSGKLPDFPKETESIRRADWKVAPIPKDLLKRKVEITGPVDRKMIVNGLNSGADVFMADFEDAHSPTWQNNLQGQLNLRDAVRHAIGFTSAEGKKYDLNPVTATLMVRPRGWHLNEKHVTFDGAPMSASLFDFGLFFFHNAKTLVGKGTGPYFYLPKMESRFEARLWNDVFVFSQKALGLPNGTIRATVLIETILAAFEMDEILYELRDHSAGLNCGRWDYIFSFIKKFNQNPAFVLPDRASVTMDKPFLKSYVELLIHTCHRRGIHAMGGMAAQIPIKNDPAANDAALEKVRQDKLREVKAGHDGTWVAHPGLVPIAREIFEKHMPDNHQLGNLRNDVRVKAADLLAVPEGAITEKGLRTNLDVGVRYLESWFRGVGCVPLYNLMEDAATAEISRTQVWQWLRHKAKLSDGRTVTSDLVQALLKEELASMDPSCKPAAELFFEMTTRQTCPDFLTSIAYERLD